MRYWYIRETVGTLSGRQVTDVSRTAPIYRLSFSSTNFPNAPYVHFQHHKLCFVKNALLVHSLSSGKTAGADVSCTVPMARPWFSSTNFPNAPEAHFQHHKLCFVNNALRALFTKHNKNCLRGFAAQTPGERER